RRTTAALVAPTANTEVMSMHLKEIGDNVARGAHAALVLDGAGYHLATGLAVPGNITLDSPAALRTRAQPDRKRLAISARQQALQHDLRKLRRYPRKSLPSMDVLRQRQGAGRFNHHTPMGKGQSLAPFVLYPARDNVTVDPTPLPSTWLMLISGFVGLGFLAYRGTKKNAVAFAAA